MFSLVGGERISFGAVCCIWGDDDDGDDMGADHCESS